MGRRITVPIAAATVLAALILSGPVLGSPPAAQAASIAERSCEDGLPDRAVCGALSVPETRGDPASRAIDLPYVVIPAETQPATGTPVVTMAGGPGQSSTSIAQALAADPRIGGTRDIIALAQRGSLESSAPLDCPAASAAYVDTFTDDSSPAAEMTTVAVELKECLAAFAEQGGNVAAYTRTETAADLVELRTVLAYPSWTLFGDSWSTKVMQTVAMTDSAGVDAVVLNAFSPIDRDIKGDAYAALENALRTLSDRSGGEYADLNTDLADTAALFSDEPVNGLLTNPFTNRQRYYSLTGSDAVTIVQQALYDPETAAAVPYLLQRLADGETDALNPIVDPVLENLSRTSLAQYWIEACRDEQPFWSADPLEPVAEGSEEEPTPKPVLTYLTAADQLCGPLGLSASAGETRTIVPQQQPALIFGSDTDPLIPLAVVQSGTGSFPNSQVVTLQGAGRAGVLADPCGMDQLAAWLAQTGVPVETTCSDLAEANPTISADDVHPTSRFDSVVTAVEDQEPFPLTIPLIFGGFAGLWFLGWLITVIVQALRRESIGLLIATGIAPVTGVAFLAALWVTVSSALAASPAFTLVGVPTVTPWLGILLGVGFLGIIPVWRLGGRAAAALAAAATIVWLGMIVWFVWVAVLPS
ncbi:alpha/beta fold hydrolase [Herbiconiux sp. VKM Ac-1786]|uniref:alpha/beta fold hydrolase n=1 Tax=Herbiconiux sp. VKM Ac-1786 TaxID=2783824 RepID=UPI00188B70BB|nr:alpha/beta fold hydrolase [Herbiconiux sp. VKM Ac-1786]